jgi:hypothetical protein
MGKNVQNMLTNHPKYPCLTESAPNQPQITAMYQKMIQGIFFIARYTFSLTGYPKIAHI